ncbi:MAG: MBL fold metallo-hydrolase [Gemmatimonadetes bacterium]|nr:MBL fold metallo-hydrolase [Gemmatimonadota bacterium]
MGGTCIEIEYDGARLILDAGLTLRPVSHGEPRLPAVDGLEMGDPSILGVIVSHGHPDHFGLVGAIHPSIPRFTGAGTQRILREDMFFTPHGIDLDASGWLADRQPWRALTFIAPQRFRRSPRTRWRNDISRSAVPRTAWSWHATPHRLSTGSSPFSVLRVEPTGF